MAVKSNFTDGTALPATDINTYLTNGGLVTIASGTATAGALIITSAFSSTYDNYRLVINAVGNNGAEITAQFRIGTATSTASYNWALWGLTEAGATANYAATGNSFLTTTYGVGSFSADIFAPFLAQETWYAGTQVMNAGGTVYLRQVGGRHTPATSYDQLVLTVPSSTTMRYSLMGYRRA